MVGVDPEKVDYLRYVSESGLGTLDTSRITVVGNARVDEVGKPFPMAKGLCRILWSRPSKTRYNDFEAPWFTVEEVTLKGTRLEARLGTDPKTTKVDVSMGGRPLLTLNEDFEHIQCALNDASPGDEITFRAYDRFLNCSIETVKCQPPVT
jgi:hypothetical protein